MAKGTAGSAPAVKKKTARKKTARKETAHKKVATVAVNPDLSQPLVLPKALVVQALPTLASAFSARLQDPGASLELYGEDVAEVDLAGLQLVLGLINSARRQSREVTLNGASDRLRATAEISGFAASLALSAAQTELEEDDLCPVF